MVIIFCEKKPVASACRMYWLLVNEYGYTRNNANAKIARLIEIRNDFAS